MSGLVYLSLGSNLGDRLANLQTAIERLAREGSINAISGFYETEPVELQEQPWFLNCVAALETDQTPEALLKTLLQIEQEMGRVRMRDKGPRLIDIDILLFDDRIVDKPGLKIPHPALHQRRFVLEPLVEIAPEAFHPQIGMTVQQLLEQLPQGPIVRRLPTPTRPRER